MRPNGKTAVDAMQGAPAGESPAKPRRTHPELSASRARGVPIHGWGGPGAGRVPLLGFKSIQSIVHLLNSTAFTS